MSHINRKYRHTEFHPVDHPELKEGEGGFIVPDQMSEEVRKEVAKITSPIRKMSEHKEFKYLSL